LKIFPFKKIRILKTIASKSRSVTAKTRALGQKGKGLGLILSTFTLSIEFYFYVYFHYSKTEPELNDHLYIYIFLFIMQIFMQIFQFFESGTYEKIFKRTKTENSVKKISTFKYEGLCE